jgi:RNA polymerase sigma factor (sigma-70 family)
MAKELQEEEIKEILIKVRSGNTTSFNKIILCYERQVFSLSLRLMKHREEAEEAAQDAFVRAFQQINTFKGNSRFSTWLYRITFNICLTRLRKNKKDFALVIEDFSNIEKETNVDTWESLQNSERNFYLTQAIEKLNNDEQVLITLFYQHERSLAEIEEITGINQNTLKVKLFRSRQKLEKILNSILQSEVKSLY